MNKTECLYISTDLEIIVTFPNNAMPRTILTLIIPPGLPWAFIHNYSRVPDFNCQFFLAPGHLTILETFAYNVTGNVNFSVSGPRGHLPKESAQSPDVCVRNFC